MYGQFFPEHAKLQKVTEHVAKLQKVTHTITLHQLNTLILIWLRVTLTFRRWI